MPPQPSWTESASGRQAFRISAKTRWYSPYFSSSGQPCSLSSSQALRFGKVETMSAMLRRHSSVGVSGSSGRQGAAFMRHGSVRMPTFSAALMIFGYQGQPAYLPSPRARTIQR